MYHNFKIPLSTSHYSSFKSNILFFNTFEVWEQQRNREEKKKKHQGEWVGGLERNKLDDLDQHLTRNAKGGSSWLLTGPLFTTPNTNPVEVHWMKRRVEKQGAVSDFSIFRILLWLQVCARSESWLGGAVGGGRWSWVTHKMSHRSSYKHKKRPRSFPPPLLLASFRCSFLLSLTHVAKKGRWHRESLHGGIIINILLINLSTGGKTPYDLQTDQLQRDRVPVWLTESAVERAWRERRKLEKSGVQVVTGREGASNSGSH